jgi:outer membrane protein assembly factor BamB
MNRVTVSCLAALLLTLPAFAQRDPGYDRIVAPQTRIDLRDLGYSPADLIPDGESAITSLSVAPNGDIYGATSGARSHLFVLNPVHGYVFPVGVIPGAASVTHAVVVSQQGHVFIGTAPTGHLLEYAPGDLDSENIQIGSNLSVTDLGAPVPGESIFALAIDRRAYTIYGLTSPNAHIFSYSIALHKFTNLGIIAKSAPMGEKFEHVKMISRMLAVDNQGNVFAAGEDGYFFEIDAKTQTLHELSIQAPAIPGREPYTRVDAFITDKSGAIYGGTSDGYLFALDPESLTVKNLGKPLNQYGVAALAWGQNGKLYGVGGDASDMARLFAYDPADGSYELLGFIDVNRRPYYTWQAYMIGDIVSDSRGTVYLGEDERVSKLYLFYP